MKKYIEECLFAFSDPYCNRVEIKADRDPQKFRKYFYNAMRRRGYYWRLSVEGDILHVMKL